MSAWVTTNAINIELEEVIDTVVTMCLYELDVVMKEISIAYYHEADKSLEAFKSCGAVTSLAPIFKMIEDITWAQPYLTNLSDRCKEITLVALNDNQILEFQLKPIMSGPMFKECLNQYSLSCYMEHLFKQVVGIARGAYSTNLANPIMSYLPVQNGIISVLGIDYETSGQYTINDINRQLTGLVNDFIYQFHSLLKQQLIDQLYDRYDNEQFSQQILLAS